MQSLGQVKSWPATIFRRRRAFGCALTTVGVFLLFTWWPYHMESVIDYDSHIVVKMYDDQEQNTPIGTVATKTGQVALDKLAKSQGKVQKFIHVRSYADFFLEPTLHVFKVMRGGKWEYELSVVSHSKVTFVMVTSG